MSWLSSDLPSNSRSVVTDGTYLYVGGSNSITRVKISDQTVVPNWASSSEYLNESYGLVIHGSYLYAAKEGEASITRISLTNPLLIETWIPTFGPGFIGLSMNNGFAYASIIDQNKIIRINLVDKTVNSDWAVGTSNRPYGSVSVGNFLYVTSQSGKIIKISLLDGSIVTNDFAPSIRLTDSTAITANSYFLYAQNPVTHKIVQISIADGSVINNNIITYFGNFYANCIAQSYLYVLNDGNALNRVQVILPPPPNTPVYLGNAVVSTTGDFNLAGTVLTSSRFPQGQNEFVPRAYVDTYIASIKDYYDHIIDPNGELQGVLDRLSYTEAQLQRVYKALWNVDRNVEAINTPQLGSIAANYVVAESPNPGLIANPPAPPASLTGFN
jgi:hypothetical protein